MEIIAIAVAVIIVFLVMMLVLPLPEPRINFPRCALCQGEAGSNPQRCVSCRSYREKKHQPQLCRALEEVSLQVGAPSQTPTPDEIVKQHTKRPPIPKRLQRQEASKF